jgi:hypothetical protein
MSFVLSSVADPVYSSRIPDPESFFHSVSLIQQQQQQKRRVKFLFSYLFCHELHKIYIYLIFCTGTEIFFTTINNELK